MIKNTLPSLHWYLDFLKFCYIFEIFPGLFLLNFFLFFFKSLVIDFIIKYIQGYDTNGLPLLVGGNQVSPHLHAVILLVHLR